MRNALMLPLLALISACGDDANVPGPGAYACESPWEIVLYNQNEIRSDCYDKAGASCDLVGIALPGGTSTKLVIGAVDERRQPCDPSLLIAAIDDESFVLANDGDDLVVTPTMDAFDLGVQENGYYIEPSATLTVSYGALVARWQVMSAIDLSGTWRITVDDLTVGDFPASQSGRFIRLATCEANDNTPTCSSGIVQRNYAHLFTPIGSLVLQGLVDPSRDKLNGNWSDGTNQGVFSAIKLP